GGTASINFTIINQGIVPTSTPHWSDKVYLSLDNEVTPDDILLGTFQNGSALAPNESYSTNTGPVTIPIRFRGDAYLIVVADNEDKVDEYPNDSNNTRAFKFHVDPKPLADLVTGGVVVPTQAVEGAQIQVRYTVTNLGSDTTNVDTWHDTIWLTTDRTRPTPSGNHGILLGTIEHNGALAVGDSYSQTLTVTLPEHMASGNYFITPWADAYDIVLEDTLAININPDDQHELDNNNYKARLIHVIGENPQQPDLTVAAVVAPVEAIAGQTYTASWTIANIGK